MKTLFPAFMIFAVVPMGAAVIQDFEGMTVAPGTTAYTAVAACNGSGGSDLAAGQYNVGETVASDCNSLWFGTTAHDGSYFMLVNGSGSANTNVYSQAVSGLTVGAEYEFAVWVAGLYTSTPAVLRLNATGVGLSPGMNMTTNVNGTWVRFSRTFIADSPTMTVQVLSVFGRNVGGDFGLDGLEVNPMNGEAETPEAGAGWLLASGLGLMGLGRWRTGVRP